MLLPEDISAIEANLKRSGFTADDLCAKAGIALTTWWRWRTGKFSPRMKEWTKAMKAYGELVPATEDAQEKVPELKRASQ